MPVHDRNQIEKRNDVPGFADKRLRERRIRRHKQTALSAPGDSLLGFAKQTLTATVSTFVWRSCRPKATILAPEVAFTEVIPGFGCPSGWNMPGFPRLN